MLLLPGQFPATTASRIVSLVPSQTELLYDLGAGNQVMGITKFCVHPSAWKREKTIVGGTKQVKREVIDSLQPDLIIANKEENVKEQVEDLATHYPVWVTDVNTLEDALTMINDVGALTNHINEAAILNNTIRSAFQPLETARQVAAIPAAYLIWRKPYMTVGGNTFINDMMSRIGLKNVFGGIQRYPAITIEDIRRTGCRLLLLSSEPYPFADKHINELALQLPGVHILLADGEMFSWYGSRLVKAAPYLQALRREIDTFLNGA